ncbi:transforming protein [Bos taurus papillomavirus 2]|uniref:Protein E6 n=1 Tax=Bos taurus papillomavirus 2 TaxID=2758382 RepID=VE6_BPV2|nr:RecName: Full=Protein E6 [Bos taurus papillomavirus 2]AAA66831.1 transforming protein [Bos taurus papillomavirus 2]
MDLQSFSRGNPFSGLACVWCREPLTEVDAFRCMIKDFHVVYRDGVKFGACTTCLENCLDKERRLWKGVPVTGEEAQLLHGKSLDRLCIRCCYCGGKLTKNEKQRHVLYNEPFCKTRSNIIRGRCYDCCRHGSRSNYP